MPTYEITAPNGKTYEITGATQEGAVAALQQMLSGQTAKPRFGTLKENIFGEGEIDTPGEYVGDLINSAGAGALRGVRGILNLPSDVGQFSSNLTRKAMGKEALPRTVKAGDAVDALVGEDRVNYVSPTTGGKYAGTIGEFAVGAVGGGPAALRTAVTAGLGSEFLGQKAEGSSFEPIARIVGAFAAPASLSAVSGIKNKTVQAFTKKAVEMPSLDTARNAKNAAYKSFEAAGGKIDVDMDALNRFVGRSIAEADDDLFIAYAANTDEGKYVDDAIKVLSKHTGKVFNIAQIDKLRAGLGRIYKNSGYDPKVKFIRDKLDEVIDAAPTTADGNASDLLKAARASNRKYKKIELFEELIDKAELGAAGTGSGGNVTNKYRQAVTKILTNRNNIAKFDSDELQVMRNFVEGSLSENTLRLIGKLSPTGNGLMTALNVGAIANNPSMVLATLTGAGSKSLSDRKAANAIQAVRKMLATGVLPEKRGLITDKDIRILLGLQADEEQQ